MAKRRSRPESFQTELAALQESITENLRMASLHEDRLEGFSYLFVLVLPLMNAEGQPVFTDAILQELFRALNERFGGCLVASASSHPPYWGLWSPAADQAAEKDYLTTIQIFANPIEATNRFFGRLKQLLKNAGQIEQQEILICRLDSWLI